MSYLTDRNPDMQYHGMSLFLLLENYSPFETQQQQGGYTPPHVRPLSPLILPSYFVIRAAKRIYSQVARSTRERETDPGKRKTTSELRPARLMPLSDPLLI